MNRLKFPKEARTVGAVPQTGLYDKFKPSAGGEGAGGVM